MQWKVFVSHVSVDKPANMLLQGRPSLSCGSGFERGRPRYVVVVGAQSQSKLSDVLTMSTHLCRYPYSTEPTQSRSVAGGDSRNSANNGQTLWREHNVTSHHQPTGLRR